MSWHGAMAMSAIRAIEARDRESLSAALLSIPRGDWVSGGLGPAAMRLAIESGFAAGITLMAEFGIDPDSPDARGMTLMMLAARLGRGTCVRSIAMAGGDPHAIDLRGAGAIHMAAMVPGDSAMSALLDHGAFDFPDGEGRTALRIAAEAGSRGAMELVMRGADPFATSGDGRSPFDAAGEPMRRMLLEAWSSMERRELDIAAPAGRGARATRI